MEKANILAISDTQEPFSHIDALTFVQHVQKAYFRGQTHDVVHVGDEVDQHTLGKWASNPNGRSAGDELEEAKHRLRDWFAAFPYCRVAKSNHTYRAYKKAAEAGLPSQFMRSIGEVYGAPPGWLWADRWILDGVCIEHGENVSGQTAALKAALDNRMSTIIGHQHTWGGVIYSANIKDLIWGMNTGCLIDVDKYAFDYGRTLRNKPTLGCGVVINGIPYFVPMILDKSGRWVGRSYEVGRVRQEG